MADKNVQIRIVTAGGDQAAAEIRKVESAATDANKAMQLPALKDGGLAAASQKIKLVERGLLDLNQAGGRVTSTNINLKSSFQNVGYQVQDFAVQVGGGTSAVRAFSQQAPQLLSALGPWGVALGTLVAVGAPLAGQLLEQAAATDTLADRSNELGEALEDATEKTIEMASKERIAGEERDASTERSLEYAESIRQITRENFAYNEVLREQIDLLKEQQSADDKLADARGQKDIEQAAGDPVKQEEVKNRVRQEAQTRELQQLAEQAKVKEDLMNRLIQQDSSVRTRGENESASLRGRADDAAASALQNEQLAELKNSEAASLKASAGKAKRGSESAAALREARTAEGVAAKASEEAQSQRNIEKDLRQQADAVAEETKQEASKAFEEANKLYKELARMGREANSKRAIFSERDQAGDARISRIRKEQDAKKSEKEDQQKRRQEGYSLDDQLESANQRLDDRARDRGLAIRGAGMRGGNDLLKQIGGMLSDGTDEKEIQKVRDQVKERKGEVSKAVGSVVMEVLDELSSLQKEVENLKGQIKKNRRDIK